MAEEITVEVAALADKLIATSIRKQLPGRALDRRQPLQSQDYIRLVNEAAILAQSAAPESRTLAYEIITHALSLSKSDHGALARASEFILARLGNFPGRELLRARYRARLENAAPIPTSLGLEAFGHEFENTVELADGRRVRLTDFQLELFESLESTSSVSVSAPTSAGKSFVLSLQILRRLRAVSKAVVIYVVPTRALIREVILRLREAFEKAGMSEVALRSVPQFVSDQEAKGGAVYVLTQERLLSLLHASGAALRVTLLVVDEAQGVRDGGRGVLLESAVRGVLRRCPNAEVAFATPMVKEPRVLLDLFGRSGRSVHRESHSPVSQSYIVVSTAKTDKKHAQFSLLRHGKRLLLGERDLGFDFCGVSGVRRRAKIAMAVTNDQDGCLIYANGAWEAEETAKELAALKPARELAKEVDEFVRYVMENIHPEYSLLEVLKKGVGFHHGEMPASVRTGVEDLFRGRKLQFLCCTGTLLQGVNLPARHLVVERPRWGNGQPMRPADFVNLAGRAGRLRREFHGSVWCVRPEYWQSQRKRKRVRLLTAC